VIFPEGTRFTPQKRERGLERGDPLAAKLARTLSPLRTGALALGSSASDLDVVIIAHTGLELAGTLGELVFGGLTRARLRVRIWRVAAADVPRGPDEFRAWLSERWLEVDAFVGS
jgi:1-acyl-sn-glycerol-3-phosphate acyltransferase